jgi:hypothetical protein
VIAHRTGRRADDQKVKNLAGAAIGVGITLWMSMPVDSLTEFLSRLDECLAHLEAGLPL